MTTQTPQQDTFPFDMPKSETAPGLGKPGIVPDWASPESRFKEVKELTPDEVREQLRSKMSILDKQKILSKMNTADLLVRLQKSEDELEKALREQASFRNLNAPFLANYGDDCAQVKEIISMLEPPEEINGKKTTVAQRDAWIARQRIDNDNLHNTIGRQNCHSFTADNLKIAIEIARTKMENTRKVLELRAAQCEFLASET